MADNLVAIEGIALLEQALRIYQTNAAEEFPPAGKLSEGMPFLLEIASNNHTLTDTALKKIKSNAEEVRNAAIAYLKIAYLQHVDNPYRVLGLSPWSQMDEVKKRHRFLIRLFHPDRGIINDSKGVDYAANINQAYTTISNKVKDRIARPYQSQPYGSNKYDSEQGNSEATHHTGHIASLLAWIKLQAVRGVDALAEINYRRYVSISLSLLKRFSILVYRFLKLISNYIVSLIIFTARMLQYGARHTLTLGIFAIGMMQNALYYLLRINVVLFQILKQTFIYLKRLGISLFQLLTHFTRILKPLIATALFSLFNYKFTSYQFKFMAVTILSVGFVMAGGIKFSQESYMHAKQYFAARQLAKIEDTTPERSVQQIAQKLALQQDQSRIQRIELEKAEAARQLALKQDQARKEAERIALEKAEAVRQAAIKNDPVRQGAEQSNVKTGTTKKSESLRFTRVLIDAAGNQKQDGKPIADISIDAQ